MNSPSATGVKNKALEGGVFKDALKQFGAYGIAETVRRLSSVLMIAIYTRYLSPHDYGILDLLDITVTFAGMLIGFRRAEALFYFYNQAKTDQERLEIRSTSILGSLSLGIAIAAFGLLFSPQIAAGVLHDRKYNYYVALSFLNLISVFPIETGFAYLRVTKRAGQFAVLSILRVIVGTILFVALLQFGMKVDAYLWANLIASGLLTCYFLFLLLRGTSGSFHGSWLLRDLRYGAPLALHGLGMLAVHNANRVVLAKWGSLAEVGIYGVAYKVGMMIAFAHSPFQQYWAAQVYGILKRSDGDRVYVRMTTYLFLGLGTLLVGLMLFLEPAMRLWAGKDFASATQYVPLIALAYFARAIGDHVRMIFRVENQNWREVRITAVVTAISLAAYFALIPSLKAWGAVWGTLLTFLVALGLSYRQAQAAHRFHFEYERILKLVFASVLAVGLKLVINPQKLWVQVVIGVFLFGLYLAVLWVLRWPEPEEKRKLHEVARRLRLAVHPVS